MCFGGGSSQTTTTSSKVPGFIQNAYENVTKAGQKYANQWGVDQPAETTAYGQMGNNANYAGGYMPYQAGLINSLYQGGGLGQGQGYINNAYGQLNQTSQPYLDQGYLNPMSNPYLQPAIEAARTGAYNDVANRFAHGGRSFSGAEAGAFGTAATNAALPMLLNQYNQNVTAQQGAAQGLLSGALGASTGLDTSQGGVLKAQMAAPGQISNLNIPQQMQLDIAAKQRQTALQSISAQAAAMGALNNYPYASTSTIKQQSDPFQALVGGGLGLLGAFL